jgi:hypothetical protein
MLVIQPMGERLNQLVMNDAGIGRIAHDRLWRLQIVEVQ